MPRWLKWTVGIVVAVGAVAVGGVFLYAKVINDAPPPLSESRPEITAPGEIVEITAPAAATVPPAGDPDEGDTAAPGSAAPAGGDAQWAATDASIVGYRVKEVLFGADTEAYGRTSQVAGTLTFDGATLTAADFTVDMTTVASDESRRDGQFHGSIMSTDEFPTATFVLTEPISAAEPTDGATFAGSASGDLTLRGVTNSVTFDIDARVENGQIVVDGTIPIVFADYGIANPSRAGITTEDHGILEFSLVFVPTA